MSDSPPVKEPTVHVGHRLTHPEYEALRTAYAQSYARHRLSWSAWLKARLLGEATK